MRVAVLSAGDILAAPEARLGRRRELAGCARGLRAARAYLDAVAPGWRALAAMSPTETIVAAATILREREERAARERLTDWCLVWALDRLSEGVVPSGMAPAAAAAMGLGVGRAAGGPEARWPDSIAGAGEPVWTIPMWEPDAATAADHRYWGTRPERIAYDAVVVPLDRPEAWWRVEDRALMLGEAWLEPMALTERRRARALPCHRTPMGWLEGGGRGWCPLVPLAELDPWIMDGVAEILTEDRDHAAEIDAWQARRRVRRPKLSYRGPAPGPQAEGAEPLRATP